MCIVSCLYIFSCAWPVSAMKVLAWDESVTEHESTLAIFLHFFLYPYRKTHLQDDWIFTNSVTCVPMFLASLGFAHTQIKAQVFLYLWKEVFGCSNHIALSSSYANCMYKYLWECTNWCTHEMYKCIKLKLWSNSVFTMLTCSYRVEWGRKREEWSEK